MPDGLNVKNPLGHGWWSEGLFQVMDAVRTFGLPVHKVYDRERGVDPGEGEPPDAVARLSSSRVNKAAGREPIAPMTLKDHAMLDRPSGYLHASGVRSRAGRAGTR